MGNEKPKRLWQDVTKAQLEDLYYKQNLSDQQIAKLYDVTKDKVAYKRRKLGISIRNKIIDDFIKQRGEVYEDMNQEAKERLFKQENVDGISKALTHYAFRNGPVENMHASGKLTQQDMKTLNKFMVNRLAGVLSAIHQEKWLQLELLCEFLAEHAVGWDPAEPDLSDLDLIWKHQIRSLEK